jgi:CBS domain-containing protein
MRVSDVMQGHAATVGPKTDLALAGRRMKAVGCGALPVVEKGNRVIGLVTDRDLLLALAELDRQPSTVTVGEMMGNDLFTCHPEDGLDSALKSMRHHKVRRLMVTDRAKRLLGILCLDDIVLYTREGGGLDPARLTETLRAICEHPLPEGRPSCRVAL